MYRAMNTSWLEVNGQMIGICLGADFTAEHEWGIQGIKKSLGIDGQKPEYSRERVKYTKPHGIARRTISNHEFVRFYEHEGAVALLLTDRWWRTDFEKMVKDKGLAAAWKHLPSDLSRTALSGAWDGEEFGLYAEGEETKRVRELYEAFRRNDIAIWLGGGAMAFENPGLAICIVSRIPAENANMMKEGDLDAERLVIASDATGIVERLNAAKKGFFACSPRWRGDHDTKSLHPVIYWLNPMEQHLNNYGWFTVEELDQWISGEGPVPMKEPKR